MLKKNQAHTLPLRKYFVSNVSVLHEIVFYLSHYNLVYIVPKLNQIVIIQKINLLVILIFYFMT